MEILTVVAQHRSYDSRERKQIVDVLQSSPSRTLTGINCRAYESMIGVLPAPSRVFIDSGSPGMTGQQAIQPLYSDPGKQCTRSNPITIRSPMAQKINTFDDDLCDSELWAGPAYSNSPPPSSLPMPNFSLRQRSMSFEICLPKFEINDLSGAKSAPSSPEKQSYLSSAEFFIGTDTATKDLRRILNLDT